MDTYSQLSYGQLHKRAEQIGKALLDRGLVSGNIVALDDLEPYELILSFWACSLAGLRIFPLNTRFPESTLQENLAAIQPELVLSTRDLLPGRSMTILELFRDAPIGMSRLASDIHPDTPLSLLMTSGTSGSAKLVQHSLANHIHSARGSNQHIPLARGDRWLVTLPLYHVGGLAVLFRTALAGAASVLPSQGQTLLQSIETCAITHVSLVATQLKRLLDEPLSTGSLSSLKAVLLGGSAIPPSLVRQAIHRGLPLYLSYGSTEMASQICTTGLLHDVRDTLTSGQLLPGRDMLISHQGEILVQGPTLAEGYLEQGRLQELRDGAGWFHTGDVGYIDFQGALTVTGRMDNQFISGGENIQPEHIESALMSHVDVLQAVVLPETDPEFGQRPVAYLQAAARQPRKAELLEHLKTMLPGYMIPRTFILLPEALFTDEMKVSRKRLRSFLDLPNNQLQTLD